MEDINLEQLLSQTPSTYFQNGFLDEAGKPRPELTGMNAFAVATQLEYAQTSLDELGLTLESLKQILPMGTGDPSQRFAGAVNEALALVRQVAKIDNNIMLGGWLRSCASFVKADADIAAFLQHAKAVMLQYAALLAVKRPPAAPEANP